MIPLILPRLSIRLPAPGSMLPCVPETSAAPDKGDGFFLSPFEIADEDVLVFRKVGVGPRNFAVNQAFFNLADQKGQFVLLQRGQSFVLEIIDVEDRVRVADSG